MKKIILPTLLLSTILVVAQDRFKAALKAGISTSQVAGDTYSGFNKAGINAGASVATKLNEKWNLQFEIMYAQKGSKHIGDQSKGDYAYYIMRLDYIEIPLLLGYKHKKFTLEFGPGYSYLISGKEYDAYGIIQNALPFKKTELNGNIGISYTIYTNWKFTSRYTNSLLPIRGFTSGASVWYNHGQRNNVLSFTLSYTFGNGETK